MWKWGNTLAVQKLGLHALTAEGLSLIFGCGTKTLKVTQLKKKNKVGNISLIPVPKYESDTCPYLLFFKVHQKDITGIAFKTFYNCKKGADPSEQIPATVQSRTHWRAGWMYKRRVWTSSTPESHMHSPQETPAHFLGLVPEMFCASMSISVCLVVDVQVAKLCPTLRPNGLQHARFPCLSLCPRVCSNSCPLSQVIQWMRKLTGMVAMVRGESRDG